MEAQVHQDEVWNSLQLPVTEDAKDKSGKCRFKLDGYDTNGSESSPSPPPKSSPTRSLPIPIPSRRPSQMIDESQSSTPSFLSEERVQKLLGSLSPVPISPLPRSKSECTMTSKNYTRVILDSSILRSSSDSAAAIHGSGSFTSSEGAGLQIPIGDLITRKRSPDGIVVNPVAVKSSKNFGNPYDGFKKLAPTISTSEMAKEIATAVRQVRHATVKIVDGEIKETGMERHNFPTINRADIERRQPQVIDIEGGNKTYKVTIPELILPISQQFNVSFTTPKVAKFLMVARNSTTDRWSIPSIIRFHDVLNKVENRLREERLQCQFVIEWNSTWNGEIGLMGLRIVDTVKLDMFRTILSEVRMGGLQYNSFPKAALAHSTEVSLMLREELLSLDLKWIPHSLFENNSMLDGNITVRFSKPIEHPDPDHEGATKPGKLVILEGDEKFLDSVNKHPNNYQFKLGSSTVSIRGDQDLTAQQDIGMVSLSSSSSSSVMVMEQGTTLKDGMGQSIPTVGSIKPFRGRGRGRGRGIRGKRGAPYQLKYKDIRY